MNCSNCGSEVDEGVEFCPSCGARVGTKNINLRKFAKSCLCLLITVVILLAILSAIKAAIADILVADMPDCGWNEIERYVDR